MRLILLRVVVPMVAVLVLVVLLAALAAPSWASNLCLDRRDYAPGYNSYRLVYCDDLPSYVTAGAGTPNWSGHDGGRRGDR